MIHACIHRTVEIFALFDVDKEDIQFYPIRRVDVVIHRGQPHHHLGEGGRLTKTWDSRRTPR